MSLPAMLAELPSACDVGSKPNSQGYKETWIGYKLHLKDEFGATFVRVRGHAKVTTHHEYIHQTIFLS